MACVEAIEGWGDLGGTVDSTIMVHTRAAGLPVSMSLCSPEMAHTGSLAAPTTHHLAARRAASILSNAACSSGVRPLRLAWTKAGSARAVELMFSYILWVSQRRRRGELACKDVEKVGKPLYEWGG